MPVELLVSLQKSEKAIQISVSMVNNNKEVEKIIAVVYIEPVFFFWNQNSARYIRNHRQMFPLSLSSLREFNSWKDILKTCTSKHFLCTEEHGKQKSMSRSLNK